ncbi:hypothetical protein T492DRAFT_866804, partial [Pavlovales sp. CCMP2436]
MAAIGGAAVALGFAAEHLRAKKTPKGVAVQDWGAGQAMRAALIGTAVVAGAAAAFPGPVRPFGSLVGTQSAYLVAVELGALYFVGAA